MIASIRGTLTEKTTTHLVVEVNGLGYLLNVTPNTAAKLTLGTEVSLKTAFVVREDSMTLFGFQTSLEQELFDLLRSVTGVGPKSALAILGSLTTGDIASAVASDNDAAFRSVSGIGPKTAKLITVTLAGKLSHLVFDGAPAAAGEGNFDSITEALVSLGWPERTAKDAVSEVAKIAEKGTGRDVILRLALARLGSNKMIVNNN